MALLTGAAGPSIALRNNEGGKACFWLRCRSDSWGESFSGASGPGGVEIVLLASSGTEGRPVGEERCGLGR